MMKMAARDTQSRIMKALGLTIWFVLQIGLFMLVVIFAWFFFTIVRDGISAQMMIFESDPYQGLDYWRSKYRNETLRGWAVPMVITAIALVALAWGTVKTAIKIRSCFPGAGDGFIHPGSSNEQPESQNQPTEQSGSSDGG